MFGMEKPKWDPRQDYLAGLKAYELAQEFKERLEPRIPAGLMDGLKEDIGVLSSIGAQQKAKATEGKGFTGSEAEARAQGTALSSAIRETLKRGHAPKDVLKGAGVGSRFQASSDDDVIASLNSVLGAYEKAQDAFRAAGVLPRDLERAKSLLSALSAADLTQETAKVKGTQTTAWRNALRKRVEDAVDRIRGAGVLEFVEEPATAARFEALVPPKGGGGETPATADETAPKPPVAKA